MSFPGPRGFFLKSIFIQPGFCAGDKERDLCRVATGLLLILASLQRTPAFRRRLKSSESFENPPSAEYPSPLTPIISRFTYIFLTVIWLVVRVPVLSVHITVVQPRVSTEGSLLIRAFFFAILCSDADVSVTTIGRPSESLPLQG